MSDFSNAPSIEDFGEYTPVQGELEPVDFTEYDVHQPFWWQLALPQDLPYVGNSHEEGDDVIWHIPSHLPEEQQQELRDEYNWYYDMNLEAKEKLAEYVQELDETRRLQSMPLLEAIFYLSSKDAVPGFRNQRQEPLYSREDYLEELSPVQKQLLDNLIQKQIRDTQLQPRKDHYYSDFMAWFSKLPQWVQFTVMYTPSALLGGWFAHKWMSWMHPPPIPPPGFSGAGGSH